MPKAKKRIVSLKTPIPVKPEPGKIYFFGEATDGDQLMIPADYGEPDDYFMMLSIPEAGIPEDDPYSDNGFSGFLARAEKIKGGWKIRALSADNKSNGSTGGMAKVTQRAVSVHYAAVRIR